MNKRRTADLTIDALTASLLANLIPGLVVGEDSISRSGSCHREVEGNKLGSEIAEQEHQASGPSMRARRKPDSALDLDRQGSTATRLDLTGRDQNQGATSSVQAHAVASSTKQHLRKRSWAKADPPVHPLTIDVASAAAYPVNDSNVTRRVRKHRLSPALEAAEEEPPDATSPSIPRPSLESSGLAVDDDDEEDERPLEDSRLEVSSEYVGREAKQSVIPATVD